MIKWISQDFSESESSKLNKLDEELQQSLKNIDSLKVEAKEKKNQEIKSMIQYFNSLTNEIESRRNEIYRNNLQLLAISTASIGILFSQKVNIDKLVFYPIVSIFLLIVICSLLIGLLFQVQSYYRYPFLKLKKYSNSWKWFYYGNQFISQINRNPLKKNFNLNNFYEPYLNGLNFELQNFFNETLEVEIKENLVQLYLLKVHNYFKNKFFLQLAKIQRFLFFSLIPVFVISILATLVFNNYNYANTMEKQQVKAIIPYEMVPEIVEVSLLKEIKTDTTFIKRIDSILLLKETKLRKKLTVLGLSIKQSDSLLLKYSTELKLK